METSQGPAAARRATSQAAVLPIVTAMVVLAAAPVAAQLELGDPVVLHPPLDQRVQLVAGWRYHPGDDPVWADPDVDDSDWAVVDSLIRDPGEVPGGWPGIGWFRRRLTLAEGVPSMAVALRAEHYGASEVYLDGHPVASFGTPAATAAAERPLYSNDFVGIALHSGTTHVLAVRYSNVGQNRYWQGVLGFWINLRSVRAAGNAYHRWTLMVTFWQMAFAGAMASIALLHLLLFLFHPRVRENLAVSAYAAVWVGYLTAFTQFQLATDVTARLAVYKPMQGLLAAAVLTGLAVALVVLRGRPSPIAWAVGAAGLAFAAWIWTWSEFRSPDPYQTLFLLVGYAEMLRVIGSAVIRRVPDAWIVAVGFVPMAAGVVFATACDITGTPRPIDIPDGLLLLPLPLALSVFLSRRSARTSRQLSIKLEEVAELSERAIEQQRRAAHEEAERRVLEAENQRRARELEAARRLQLAMLPAEPPSLEGLDVAFRMETATEVGGDYVDVRPNGGDGVLLAVGDATSHGLQAGMVVAVAKSLFQGVGPSDKPATVLRRVADGLGAMRERHASMAMAVLRVEHRKLTLASAGMPPLLVARARSGSVEEVLVTGPPLGTVARDDFEEREVHMEAGDTALIMSDGLVEAVSRDGEPFGYERAAALLGTLAGRSAAAVVEGMFEAVHGHLAGPTPQDDITLVVLVAR